MNTLCRNSRPTLHSLLMIVGLLIVSSLVVVSCGSGGSSSNGTGNGPGGNGSCDISVATEDCDEDTILNGVDNCPMVANLDQDNSDTDDMGNACDVDDDNDGLIEIYNTDMLWAVHCDPDGTSYTAPMTTADGATMLGTNGRPVCGTASTDGAADTATSDCTTETAPGIYLCGYELGASFDFPTNWVSLPDRGSNGSFSGIFEGNGYELNNLAYVSIGESETNGGGLFDSVEVTSTIIRNLGIDGTLSAGSVDGIVGFTGGIAGSLGGTMIAVSSRATISDINVRSASATGALVGSLGGAIYSSFNSGTLTAAAKTSTANLGGLVGGISGSDGTVDNSYVGGTLQGSSQGDIVGGLSGNGGPRTTNSYVSASVNGGVGADFVGGLVGAGSLMAMTSYYNDANVKVANDDGSAPDTKSNPGMMVTDAQLRGCKQGAPIDTGNDPGGCINLYVGWEDKFWDFGTRMELPALKYSPISEVAGDECSPTTGVDAAELAANFRPNAIAQPYCGKLLPGQGR